MAFESKRQCSKGETVNGNGAGSHDRTVKAAANVAQLDERDEVDERDERDERDDGVLRYVPSPPAPRDFGREQADRRAESQSIKSSRLRQHLDCEPPWDILRVRASFASPASPHMAWPDRFDIWPADMAGYWPCPICDTPLVAVDRTAMQLFRCLTCETETVVHVKAPVVDCPRHGRREIDLPWRQNDMKWTCLGTEPSEH